MTEKKKILVIDDDEYLLLTTRELLEIDGYDVSTHNCGFGTLNKVHEEKPDLILLDINMPALSGDRIADMLVDKPYSKDIPIVFYSSNDEDSLRKQAWNHKVRGYICKGDPSMLRRKVSHFLKT